MKRRRWPSKVYFSGANSRYKAMRWEEAPNVPGGEGGLEALPHPQTWTSHSVPARRCQAPEGGVGRWDSLNCGGALLGSGGSLLSPLASAGLVDEILVSGRTVNKEAPGTGPGLEIGIRSL